jgi:hypothetical protein
MSCDCVRKCGTPLHTSQCAYQSLNGLVFTPNPHLEVTPRCLNHYLIPHGLALSWSLPLPALSLSLFSSIFISLFTLLAKQPHTPLTRIHDEGRACRRQPRLAQRPHSKAQAEPRWMLHLPPPKGMFNKGWRAGAWLPGWQRDIHAPRPVTPRASSPWKYNPADLCTEGL